MKITIEPTDKMVLIDNEAGSFEMRIWQGETDNGVPVHCFISRIAAEVPADDPDIEAKTAVFEEELQRCTAPRATVRAIPLKMVL